MFSGGLYGLPYPTKPPRFSKDDFKIYIPKLAWVMNEKSLEPLVSKAIKKCQERLNAGALGTDYDEAICLAVAHFLVQTLPSFAESTDSDPTVGGVMSNRSMGGVSYNYDISYTMPMDADSGIYGYYLTTGYGRRLVNLILNRGFVGVIVT